MIDQLLGQTIAGKYRIEAFMRLTDFGKMFRARHLYMDRPVTITLLEPAFGVDENVIRQFNADARAAAQISHPNVLAVTDFGTDGLGTHYVVYEEAVGRTMKETLASEGRLGVQTTVEIAKQIAAGLSAAHAQGLVHGDLTPSNILVNEQNGAIIIKLFDFDLTTAVPEDPSGIGTIHDFQYLAPEQLAEAPSADHRSDIYSLGVILFEMLAGELPFTGSIPAETAERQMAEPPPPLASFREDLPPQIEPVVLKSMAIDPDMRYQTAAELYDDLGKTFSGIQPKAATPANSIWKTAFIVLAGISLLSAVLIYSTSVKQTDPTTQLQTDANGQPVQPINPATGIQEDSLANMSAATAADFVANSNSALPTGSLPGGDGYNPWGNGGAPPPGAPRIGPGGQVITIDPNNPSQFMPADGGVILVPVPANTNTAPKPSPTPRTPAANANISSPPAVNTAPKSTPTPAKASTTPAKTPPPTKPTASKPELDDKQ